jgi:hypothetical protein
VFGVGDSTVNRMPVSSGPPPGASPAVRAIEAVAPGGATSIQRIVGEIGASRRFSKPSVST